ncbi:MAG: hypothetical protein J6S14_15745 [Clostridia bacterium]|nr:hypothetical protein [Clostridia bacterium]
MMQNEFEALIGETVTPEDYRDTIEYIYMNSTEYGTKEAVVEFYKTSGIDRMDDYASFMRGTHEIWSRLQGGEFPGIEATRKMLEKALAPDTNPADEVDVYDWEFRTFLRRLSCLLMGYGTDTMHKASLIAKELYANPTLKALTQSFADKKCDQADNYTWILQGHIGSGDPLSEVTDYSRLYLDVLETMGYNI